MDLSFYWSCMDINWLMAMKFYIPLLYPITMSSAKDDLPTISDQIAYINASLNSELMTLYLLGAKKQYVLDVNLTSRPTGIYTGVYLVSVFIHRKLFIDYYAFLLPIQSDT